MQYPDVELAFKELIESQGYKAVFHVPKDFEGSDTLVQIALLPTARGNDPLNRTETIQVSINHGNASRTEAKSIAQSLDAFLDGKPHVTSAGVLDRVLTQISPAEVLIDSDKYNVFNATYSVDVRPIF